MRINRRLAAAFAALMLAAMSAPAAVAQDEGSGDISVVATTEVLGAIVRDVVGDATDVTVIMDPGADPHTWQPSARDAERIVDASLLIENGLGLEEGLIDIIEQARADGVRVFTATDHIAVIATDDDHADDGHDAAAGDDHDDHAEDGDHAHGPDDPHFWLDPLAMREVVEALAPVLVEIGVDQDDRAEALATDLTSLDTEIESILSTIEPDARKLVAGHESLAYFAERYGFSLVGTVIPGDTSSGEPSARDIAELIDVIAEEGVSVIFTDVATPQSVARAVADEAGASVVELDVAQLPEDGGYRGLTFGIARTIASALGS